MLKNLNKSIIFRGIDEKEINEIQNLSFTDYRSTGSYPTIRDI